MPGNDTTVTMEQMRGAVGSLLLLWSQIERELADSLDALHHDGRDKPTHGIARTLNLWSHEMQKRKGQRVLAAQLQDLVEAHLREALSVRNLVCHGLIGITARIRNADEEAHLTVELGDVTRNLSWTELQTMFEWMSRARFLIRDLTAAVLATDPLHGDKLLQGWEEFPHRR